MISLFLFKSISRQEGGQKPIAPYKRLLLLTFVLFCFFINVNAQCPTKIYCGCPYGSGVYRFTVFCDDCDPSDLTFQYQGVPQTNITFDRKDGTLLYFYSSYCISCVSNMNYTELEVVNNVDGETFICHFDEQGNFSHQTSTVDPVCPSEVTAHYVRNLDRVDVDLKFDNSINLSYFSRDFFYSTEIYFSKAPCIDGTYNETLVNPRDNIVEYWKIPTPQPIEDFGNITLVFAKDKINELVCTFEKSQDGFTLCDGCEPNLGFDCEQKVENCGPMLTSLASTLLNTDQCLQWEGACDSKLDILRTGAISIGTDGTAGRKLSVKGTITTEQLKVCSDGGWCDYVFEDNYGLMPLSDLDLFIHKYKHLPKMPSAEEIVDKGGIDMEKMVVSQQEKIEEIFLHLIGKRPSNRILSARFISLSFALNKNTNQCKDNQEERQKTGNR